MWGGRRWRRREKSGEGKTVRAFTRVLVTGSSRVRCGLNWYLCGRRREGVLVRWLKREVVRVGGRKGGGSDRANVWTSGTWD